MIEMEEIELVKVTKKNGIAGLQLSPDTDKYEAYGILKTWVQAMEKKLIGDWKPEKEKWKPTKQNKQKNYQT